MAGADEVDPRDERRHDPAPGVEEAWWLDFAAGDGSVAGYVRLAYRYTERVAWWWAAVVRTRQPLVMVRAHDVPIPARGTEIRSDGVWSCLTCETPLVHWSVGLEAFGVALADPRSAWGDERGDVIPFGLDLEWEATGEAVAAPGGKAYGQWSTVHGEVLIGDERIAVDATGHREHGWGAALAPGWRMAVGSVWGRDRWAVAGRRDGAHAATLLAAGDASGFPGHFVLDGGTGPQTLIPLGYSPVLVEGLSVVHAPCRTNVGPPAVGWVSWIA